MPGFIDTCDPSHGAPPSGDLWAHEVKWDGYRGQAHLKDGKVKIFTRRGNDWSKTFYPIAAALSRLKVESAILDGEVVALKGGVSDGSARYGPGRRGPEGWPPSSARSPPP